MTPQQKAQEIYNKLVVHIQRYDEYVDDTVVLDPVDLKLKAFRSSIVAIKQELSIVHLY